MNIKKILGFVLALTLVVAACGDDSGADPTEAPQPETTTTTVAETADTTAAPEPTEAPSPDATEAPEETSPPAEPSGELAGLQAALNQTAEAQSGRMEGSFEITGVEGLPGGGTMEMPFSGAFNANGDFSFIMDLSGLASAGGEEIPAEFASMFDEMEIRQVGDTSYIRFPFFNMFLGVESEWIAAPVEDAGDVTGGFTMAAPTSPAELLSTFSDANAEIEDLGRETVNDVEATHYRVTFDTEAIYELASEEEKAELEAQSIPIDTLPMEMWITDDGLVTRFVMDIDGSAVEAAPGEGFDSMIVEYNLVDLGSDTPIEAPTDVTSVDELGELFDFDVSG